MTDCTLSPHPTDPTLCWCEACGRTLPARLLHARRNCLVPDGPPPEPRPWVEWDALKAACMVCPNRRTEIPFWCALDERRGSCVKTRGELYRRRLEFRGNECGPWKEKMGSH